jgi:hypothetical protein
MRKRNLHICLAFVELGRDMTNFLEETIYKTFDTDKKMLLFKYKNNTEISPKLFNIYFKNPLRD